MPRVDTAMIMAAGLGTRMRPLTEDRPKPLVEVAGKTLLDHVMDKARLAQIGNVVVNVHYLPEQIEAHLANHAQDLTVAISDERDLLMETGGGLVKAEHMIEAEPFYCLNSDAIWTDEGDADALSRLADAWDGERMDGLLLIVPRDRAHQHSGKGDFFLDEEGRLIRRGYHDSAPWIYTGNQLISHRLIRNAPEGPFSTNLFWDRAIAEGRLFGLVHQGDWFDIGSPEAIVPTEAALAVHG
ncbi:MAG: nucleotidyltransferase family protein [Sphingomonadales bacterium]|jgi:MurNAc alpha-1-phosphate uridylyltransferase|nr:nucleotidyltransferase family protein [Sphingomonadales bacterium]MBK9003722.1 nucleotidyltransferase family protein [Sphingomonadales bacterium]MBK9268896.1 nucleotidyltransferase family protein [Sphingomonadales bacterium]MBP6434587.1 nucleotidyltransferase family protein [Sphingorhabdus sp.]